jgi:hypothetical protein
MDRFERGRTGESQRIDKIKREWRRSESYLVADVVMKASRSRQVGGSSRSEEESLVALAQAVLLWTRSEKVASAGGRGWYCVGFRCDRGPGKTSRAKQEPSRSHAGTAARGISWSPAPGPQVQTTAERLGGKLGSLLRRGAGEGRRSTARREGCCCSQISCLTGKEREQGKSNQIRKTRVDESPAATTMMIEALERSGEKGRHK